MVGFAGLVERRAARLAHVGVDCGAVGVHPHTASGAKNPLSTIAKSGALCASPQRSISPSFIVRPIYMTEDRRFWRCRRIEEYVVHGNGLRGLISPAKLAHSVDGPSGAREGSPTSSPMTLLLCFHGHSIRARSAILLIIIARDIALTDR